MRESEREREREREKNKNKTRRERERASEGARESKAVYVVCVRQCVYVCVCRAAFNSVSKQHQQYVKHMQCVLIVSVECNDVC